MTGRGEVSLPGGYRIPRFWLWVVAGFFLVALLVGLEQLVTWRVFFDPSQVIHHDVLMVVLVSIAVTILILFVHKKGKKPLATPVIRR